MRGERRRGQKREGGHIGLVLASRIGVGSGKRRMLCEVEVYGTDSMLYVALWESGVGMTSTMMGREPGNKGRVVSELRSR